MNAGQAEFNKFVTDYQPRLTAYASHFISNRQDVNDIVQTVFINLWEHYSGKSQNMWPRLVFTIIRNLCINYLKQRKVHSNDSIEVQSVGEEKLYYFDFGTASPYLYQELENMIESVLSSLPERRRKVFEMSRFEHKKNKEIAQELGISVSGVEKHLSKALKAFEGALPPDASLPMLILVTCLFIG